MTSFDTVIEAFYRRIEKDKDFFLYIGLDGEASMALAHERAMGCLNEAVGMFILMCHPSIDLTDIAADQTGWNADLNATEIYLLAALTYRQYLQRDIAYLKTLSRDYTSTDLRVFSPSDARNSFAAMFRMVDTECTDLMDMYKSTDRTTGQYLTINYSSFDTE